MFSHQWSYSGARAKEQPPFMQVRAKTFICTACCALNIPNAVGAEAQCQWAKPGTVLPSHCPGHILPRESSQIIDTDRYVTYIGPQSTRTLFANLCEIAPGKKAVHGAQRSLLPPQKKGKATIYLTRHCICYSYAKLSLHSVNPCDSSLFSSSWAHFRTSWDLVKRILILLTSLWNLKWHLALAGEMQIAEAKIFTRLACRRQRNSPCLTSFALHEMLHYTQPSCSTFFNPLSPIRTVSRN